MKKMDSFSRKLIFCSLLAATMAIFSLVLAEETPTSTVTVENIENEVTAQDLGVTAPTVLPDNRFYFLKDWQRSLKLAFTFNQIKKAEVRQEIVNEKLIELKALAAKTQDPKILEKAAANSQKHIEKLKAQIEKFQDNAQTSPKINKFLDKFIRQGLLQQKVLEELETKVPPQVMLKIEAVRERHLEKFGKVMSKLEDKDKIAARINNILENQTKSDFKQLKDLQILKELEEKLPSEVQDSIRQLQEKSLNVFLENLEKISVEKQEKIGDYLQKMGGNKEKQLEILETLRREIKHGAIQNKLEQAKDKIIGKIEQAPRNEKCPIWTAPVPGFCKEGRIVVNKDPQTGCRLPARCVVTEEIEKNIKRDTKDIDNHAISIQSNEKISCRTDSDCACGRKKDTQECFYGNINYVDANSQCPDFCNGITGKLIMRCVNNVCTQSQ